METFMNLASKSVINDNGDSYQGRFIYQFRIYIKMTKKYQIVQAYDKTYIIHGKM